MKKTGLWVGIVVGVLVVAAVVLVVVSGSAVDARLNKVYSPPPVTLTVPTDAASIAAGEKVYIDNNCASCHGADLSGGILAIDQPNIQITGANLTSADGAVGSEFKTAEWVNSIRYGVDEENKPLLVMPSEKYVKMSDQDLGALIAYIQSVPPVTKETPDHVLTWLGKVMMTLGQLDVIAAEKTLP